MKSDRAVEFESTQWSIVLAAGQTHPTKTSAALETLCRIYWIPLYAYARKRTSNEDDAEDLTQDFFSHILHKQVLSNVSRERGRFRSFLLTCFKHFMNNQWQRSSAKKRGGGKNSIQIDTQLFNQQYAMALTNNESAERLFLKQWALTLMDRVRSLLRDEMSQNGKEHLFDRLSPFLAPGDSSLSYRDLAEELQMSTDTIRVTVYRLRRRYGELLRHEVAQTLADADELDDEIRFLFDVLSK